MKIFRQADADFSRATAIYGRATMLADGVCLESVLLLIY